MRIVRRRGGEDVGRAETEQRHGLDVEQVCAEEEEEEEEEEAVAGAEATDRDGDAQEGKGGVVE
eukprot:573154-Rhodomonas_salina.1